MDSLVSTFFPAVESSGYIAAIAYNIGLTGFVYSAQL